VERNFFGDESLTDIADSLGVTLSRVSQMRARALTLLHAAMSEIWDGTVVPAEGGVRARNQQRAYVDRVAARQLAGRTLGSTTPAAPPSFSVPQPRVRQQHGWPGAARTAAAVQPA